MPTKGRHSRQHNRAAKSSDERVNLFLDSNPLRGLKTLTEKNPIHVILTEEGDQALLRVSRQVDWRSQVALVLVRATGHRIGVVRQLRRTDIDLDDGDVLWTAEHEKSGYEHTMPVTAEAIAAPEEARQKNPANAPVLPASRGPSTCMGFPQVCFWWKRAEKVAALEPKRGRGWHSLRRKFASDLMDQPVRVLYGLGGWKTAETVL